ncbi:MAG: KTSC domain-containing protein [Actinobacteria bacterium]|nr:KTSC domain-containing protein [Actinomycetota bacterium]
MLGPGQPFTIRWKPQVEEREGKLVLSAEVNTLATVTAGALRLDCLYAYEISQGKLDTIAISVPPNLSITQVKGEDIREWNLEDVEGKKVLRVVLSRPRTGTYTIQILAEAPLGALPLETDVALPRPMNLVRERGSLAIGTDHAIQLQVMQAGGLSQIDVAALPRLSLDADVPRQPPANQLFCYTHVGGPLQLHLALADIVPSYDVNQRITLAFGEEDLDVTVEMELDIRDAPIRRLQMNLPAGLSVAEVTGEDVEDFAPMASPLFAVASAAVRKSATQQFQRSTYAKLLTEVEAAKRIPQRLQAGRFGSIVQKYGSRIRPENLANEMMGQDFGRMVRQMESYARGGGLSSRLVDDFLGSMGSAGKLIKSLMGSGGGLNRDIAAATKLLESFGHVVIPPKGAPTVGQLRAGTQGLIDYLETQGHQVTRKEDLPVAKRLDELPSGGKPTLPFGVSPTTLSGKPRKAIVLPDPSGNLRVPVDHPAVTGDFVSVDSSNVHSIAYDAENALLYVRYLAPAQRKEKRTRPGALYQYKDITPRQFDAFVRSSSKGGWVWDELRIRGTVAGYRKPYSLVGVMNGYVPRQATIMPGGQEWFIKRNLYVGKGQWLQSQLQEGPAGINRGTPNNGAPSLPNNGRR